MVSSAAASLARLLHRLQLCLWGHASEDVGRQVHAVLQHLQPELASNLCGVLEHSGPPSKGLGAAQSEAVKARAPPPSALWQRVLGVGGARYFRGKVGGVFRLERRTPSNLTSCC